MPHVLYATGTSTSVFPDSSVASIERLEERTYVLTMPMQPVPAAEVLEARGLEHSGHTWDQILELGFPA